MPNRGEKRISIPSVLTVTESGTKVCVSVQLHGPVCHVCVLNGHNRIWLKTRAEEPQTTAKTHNIIFLLKLSTVIVDIFCNISSDLGVAQLSFERCFMGK